MTTTQIKLDPEIQPTINAIKKAHAKAKLPGTFLALLPESNQYYLLGDKGAVKHKFSVFDGKLTIHFAGGKVSVNL